MKVVKKYRPRLNINKIKEERNSDLCFSYFQIERDEIAKDINRPKTNTKQSRVQIQQLNRSRKILVLLQIFFLFFLRFFLKL